MSAAADIFRQAAQANRNDERRVGSTVHLEGGCDVIVTGDLHGHRRNLTKVLDYAALPANPMRRLILQEIIHGPIEGGYDRSIDMLLRAARLKLAHPSQVLFVMGNHDLAQATGNEIAKEGSGVCKLFEEGVRFAFGEQATDILAAVNEFLLSMPLAVRTRGDTLIAHSLPAPARMGLAGTEILARGYNDADFRRGGAVYEWTWGRSHTPQQLASLAQQLAVRYFALGHKHVESFERLSELAMVLSSDGERGVVMHFDADAPLSDAAAQAAIRPILTMGAT
jgi:hypothetical protein